MDQVVTLCFCLLQAIVKNWTIGRAGNEAILKHEQQTLWLTVDSWLCWLAPDFTSLTTTSSICLQNIQNTVVYFIDLSLSIRFPWYYWRSSAEAWRSGSVVAWTHFTTIPRIIVQCIRVTLMNVLKRSSSSARPPVWQYIPWKPDAQKGVYMAYPRGTSP